MKETKMNDDLKKFTESLDNNLFYVCFSETFEFLISGPAPGETLKKTLDEELPDLKKRAEIFNALKDGKMHICELKIVKP